MDRVRRTIYATPIFFFFFNDTATTEIYTLSLHDALPISIEGRAGDVVLPVQHVDPAETDIGGLKQGFDRNRPDEQRHRLRSEEHTSELQSRLHLVCRLLLEKKKKKNNTKTHNA